MHEKEEARGWLPTVRGWSKGKSWSISRLGRGAEGRADTHPASAGEEILGFEETCKRNRKIIAFTKTGRNWRSFWRTDEANLWCYVNMKA